jgi:hypothetical protein
MLPYHQKQKTLNIGGSLNQWIRFFNYVFGLGGKDCLIFPSEIFVLENF